MIPTKEYILCAAIHYDDGKKHVHQPKNIESGFVVCGRRHHNCIASISIMMEDKYEVVMVMREHQGFVTSLDRYVDRKEGYFIAKEAGQLLHDKHDMSNPQLVSEDLYSEDIY